VRNSYVILAALMVGGGTTIQDTGGTTEQINARYVQEHTERIAGHENEPSSRVFKNIRLKWFKDVPAGQLVDIMNGGYSRALGVRCTYCHNPADFASDQKRTKRAAREMATMHWNINQTLASMRNLESSRDDRFINCATCHRGQVDPHEQPH
jgi:Photosynthetic reaction centre cytochrome C subunit